MGLRKCEKCGEEVDAVKAFCPECGNPFVEEVKREESSEFDNYAGTAQFSKSMYQEMLTEIDSRPVQASTGERENIFEKKSKEDSQRISLSAIESKNIKPEVPAKSKLWIPILICTVGLVLFMLVLFGVVGFIWLRS